MIFDHLILNLISGKEPSIFCLTLKEQPGGNINPSNA